jgi:UDP-N-acetylglucosamine--N-acetylmuramyl-(pentapeptide) pyrophosphoryl-undecaprenol N-acetylglucosamine transferase
VLTILVASVGGHLKQLYRLAPRISELGDEILWVTYRTSQSESLLAGRRVLYGPETESRDYRGVAANAWIAARLFRSHSGRTARVVSTGSAIALSFIPIARLHGVPCHYIESAARATRPSRTGELMRRVPGVALYTQYPGWARPPWRYVGSVFDDFMADPRLGPQGDLRRVVVTLGTSTLYGFRRLVERMIAILPEGVEVVWQTGVTDVSGLAIASRPYVPAAELDQAICDADVIVTHAGTGSALSALEAGRCPVLVPRRRSDGENVDDHQELLAADLARRGLAVDARVETLSLADLETAMRRRVVARPDAPPLRLSENVRHGWPVRPEPSVG